MKLEEINVEKFKCFDKLNFKFPAANGLYLLLGKNNETPSLGGNGTGKSSLFDAICWCLYEKTAKGTKAGKLKKRKSTGQGYKVSLKFDDKVIERTWKMPGNSLKLDGVECQNSTIESAIGLTFDQFLYSVYIHQGGDHFIDATPGEKIDFLSEVFDLNRWTTFEDFSKDKLKTETLKRDYVLNTITSIKSSIVDLNIRRDMVIHQQAGWEVDRQKGIELEKTKISELQQSQQKWIFDLQLANADKQARITELRGKLTQPDMSQIQAQMDQKTQEINALNREGLNLEVRKWLGLHAAAKANCDLTQKQFEDLISKINQTCPSCKQAITPEHVTACSEQLIELAQKQNIELLETIKNHAAADEAYSQSTIKYDALMIEFNDLNNQRASLQSHKQAYDGNLAEAVRLENEMKNPVYDPFAQQIEACQLRITSPQKNPYDDVLALDSTRLLELEAKLLSEETALKGFDAEIVKHQALSKHFPLVRLFILDEVIQDLEIYFNQAMSALGLLSWSVKLNTTRELVSEKTKRELNVQISKDGLEVDLESLSGGERQRVRLAAAIGISDLIKARKGVNWNLIEFDEPSLGLSAEGIQDMVDFFKTLAVNGHQVFLAEHRVSTLTRFDGIVEITKDEKGSSSIALRGVSSQKPTLQPVLAG